MQWYGINAASPNPQLHCEPLEHKDLGVPPRYSPYGILANAIPGESDLQISIELMGEQSTLRQGNKMEYIKYLDDFKLES